MQAFDRFLLAVLLPSVAHCEDKLHPIPDLDIEDKHYSGDVRIGKEKHLKSQVLDLQWLGKDQSTVLLRTKENNLHRSADGGETWVDIRSKFNQSGTPVSIRRLVRSAADNSTVFAEGLGQEHFVSVDSGETWERLEHKGSLQNLLFHSSRKTWALFSSWTNACLGKKTNKICSHNLYLTKDLGRTVTLVQTHIVQFSWGKPEFSQEDRVYFTHFRDKTIFQKRLTRWMEGVDLAYTEDLEHEKPEAIQLVPGGNKFQISYQYILAVKVKDPVKQNVTLMISSDGAKSFSPALLPHRLWQHSFALLDASDGALVLHVNQGKDVGDVFISDKSGKNFTMSLEKNVRQGGICAFEKVMNLNGVFIANVFGDHNDTLEEPEEQDAEPTDGWATGAQVETLTSVRWRRLEAAVTACPGGEVEGLEGCPPETQSEQLQRVRRGRTGVPGGAGYRRLSPQLPGKIRTVISFDAGGYWSYLKPPKMDSVGELIQCKAKEACFLNLHDFTALPQFGPVYSYKNAVGILMATGNIGPELSFKTEDTNTYLSRDGGLSWVEAHKGAFIYEFGNFGGLLVMADLARETKTALFSWNEGDAWLKFVIADHPMKVENIVTEPNAKSMKFLIYGQREGVGGLSRFLDFSQVYNRSCRGIGEADANTSDYETWSPKCIRGEKGVYIRRKQSSKCLNDLSDRYSTKGPCTCSKQDWECEVGFERDVSKLFCHPMNGTALARGVLSGCIPGSNVTVYHYRKVPGNKCQKGWHPFPKYMTCPGPVMSQTMPPAGGTFATTPLTFTLTVLLGVLVCALLLTRSRRVRHFLRGLNYKARVPVAGGGRRIGREMEGLASASSEGYLRYEPS